MKTKKLFLISQTVNRNYDAFDSAVVCVFNKKEAQTTSFSYGWVHSSDVTVEYLGLAKRSMKLGLICASFNAG